MERATASNPPYQSASRTRSEWRCGCLRRAGRAPRSEESRFVARCRSALGGETSVATVLNGLNSLPLVRFFMWLRFFHGLDLFEDADLLHRLGIIPEDIADAPDSMDEARLTKLVAQVTDVDLHDVRGAFEVESPDAVHD